MMPTPESTYVQARTIEASFRDRSVGCTCLSGVLRCSLGLFGAYRSRLALDKHVCRQVVAAAVSEQAFEISLATLLTCAYA